MRGALAQSVEQWIENPRVPGSIPGGATMINLFQKDVMETLITVVHVAVALFLILVVLVQGGNSGGVGAAFGGGNTQGMFGAAGATSFLGKLTYGAAFIFMMTSISLVVMQGGRKPGLADKINEKVAEEQKAEETKVEPETAVPAPSADSPVAEPAAAQDVAPVEPAAVETPASEASSEPASAAQ